ncbi:INO80 complex subunit B [Coemansia sp. RSA 986]|nr:INO80 complex subunit B [Coemansia sp. RSA 986]
MPLKRKALREEDTASFSGTEDDESSVDLGSSLRPRTRRRKERESSAKASPTPSSPALNTRRSSRLTAQTEKPKRQAQSEARPRARLTRGLRRGSKIPSPTPSRGGGRGSRGRRGRGRPPKLGTARDGSTARGTHVDARLDDSDSSPSNTDTESTGDYDMIEHDSADQMSNGEPEESTGGSASDDESEESQTEDAQVADDMSDSQRNTARGNVAEDEEEVVEEEEEEEEEEKEEEEEENEIEGESVDNDDTKGSILDDDEQESDDENGSDDKRNAAPKGKNKPSAANTAKKGKRGRGPGRPKAAEYVSEDSDNNMDGDEGLEMDDANMFDFADTDGGLGARAQANLTRRQRAKLTRDYDEELLELPVESKRSKFSAEEVALRKSEHARRRKFQSMQRAEQLKNDTINRLLNKQTSKGRNKVSEDAETRATSADDADDDGDDVPDRIRYTQRVGLLGGDGATKQADGRDSSVCIEYALSLPKGTTLNTVIPSATPKGFVPNYPPPAPACSVQGCNQKKKYSVNSHAACSLEHWRILTTAPASANE